MTDKERIEKLLIGTQYEISMLQKLRAMVEHPLAHENKSQIIEAIDTIINSNKFVIDMNADQIKLDL